MVVFGVDVTLPPENEKRSSLWRASDFLDGRAARPTSLIRSFVGKIDMRHIYKH